MPELTTYSAGSDVAPRQVRAERFAREAVDHARTVCAAEGQLPPSNVGVAFLFGTEPTDRALAGWMPIYREQDSPGTEKSIRKWLAY